ncbi:MAG: hypothetical protein ABFR32_03530 [Bacteroidota bacterium]
MTKKDYLKDITEIKNIMNRSSRFLSLSGLSGILAGIYAIIGALFAYYYLFPKNNEVIYFNSLTFKLIILDLTSIAFLSIISAFILSSNKAKRTGEPIWNKTTKRLLINFLIPLVTGGIYILIKLSSQHYGLSASLMLIFYGLALVNASNFTLGDIKYLGYAEIILGLISTAFPGYGFWFWVLGFGIFHIIYGTFMYIKEKQIN